MPIKPSPPTGSCSDGMSSECFSCVSRHARETVKRVRAYLRGRRGVDCLGERLKFHATGAEIVEHRYQVAQVPAHAAEKHGRNSYSTGCPPQRSCRVRTHSRQPPLCRRTDLTQAIARFRER